mmetsp:Transcript_7056/g.20414  ORF Transcript_7056/g.20414 Transcript_7056/m.20414 type:complete len:218 (-) Transcript_7056:700-1353(-)
MSPWDHWPAQRPASKHHQVRPWTERRGNLGSSSAQKSASPPTSKCPRATKPVRSAGSLWTLLNLLSRRLPRRRQPPFRSTWAKQRWRHQPGKSPTRRKMCCWRGVGKRYWTNGSSRTQCIATSSRRLSSSTRLEGTRSCSSPWSASPKTPSQRPLANATGSRPSCGCVPAPLSCGAASVPEEKRKIPGWNEQKKNFVSLRSCRCTSRSMMLRSRSAI